MSEVMNVGQSGDAIASKKLFWEFPCNLFYNLIDFCRIQDQMQLVQFVKISHGISTPRKCNE